MRFELFVMEGREFLRDESSIGGDRALSVGDESRAGTREAPAVIRVVPPFEAFLPGARLLHRVCVMVAPAIVMAVVSFVLGDAFLLWLIVISPILIGTYAVLVVIGWVFGIGYQSIHVRQRERYERAFGDDVDRRPDDPVAAAIWELWKRKGMWPKKKAIQKELSRLGISDRCRVIVLSERHLPNVGEIFFEPVIVTPTELEHSSPARLLASALMLIGIIFIYRRFGFGLPPVFAALCALIVIPAGVGYLKRVVFQGSHIRIMPGLIQFLRIPSWSKSPSEVREYPMIAGTTVVFCGTLFMRQRGRSAINRSIGRMFGKRAYRWASRSDRRSDERFGTLQFHFFREGRIDSVNLSSREIISELTKKGRVGDAIWKAVLTTARIPSITDRELLG